jgi:hypothetical protein
MEIRLFEAKTDEQELWDKEMAPILTGIEAEDRLVIQKWIDKNRFKPDVLYNGNSVLRKDKIVSEFKHILKRGTLDPMSDYFYNFLQLDAGSIAHLSTNGWIATYGNSAGQLCEFFLRNEFGNDIASYQPRWRTDCIAVCEELLEIIQQRKTIKDKAREIGGNE